MENLHNTKFSLQMTSSRMSRIITVNYFWEVPLDPKPMKTVREVLSDTGKPISSNTLLYELLKLLGPKLSPVVVRTCITASCSVSQGCLSPALRLFKNQTPVMTLGNSLFSILIYSQLSCKIGYYVHFHGPSPAIIEPFPMVLFDLKK